MKMIKVNIIGLTKSQQRRRIPANSLWGMIPLIDDFFIPAHIYYLRFFIIDLENLLRRFRKILERSYFDPSESKSSN